MRLITLGNAASGLVRLSSSDLQLRCDAEDIRGWRVHDPDGREIGEVKDLLIDDRELRVRMLEVAASGFPGLERGERTFLIPVDAITTVTNDAVELRCRWSELSQAPVYSPPLIDEQLVRELCGFFGSSPFWVPGYQYPFFARYYV